MKDIDWSSLTFDYYKTNCNVRCYYRDGSWGKIEVTEDEYIPMHVASVCFHYGQAAFEGLKAYRCPDGHIRLFRAVENAKRLQSSCQGLVMPEIPTDLFIEMTELLVRENEEYVPPYETGATLYIRPLVIGTTAKLGVAPGWEFLFVILASPVGPYFKGGFQSYPFLITRDHDRAAPLGTGRFKVAANYAGSLLPGKRAHEAGYASECYLDAKEKKYIDECGAANFFGIKDNTYVTPDSPSILPSITNKSVMAVAQDLGMTVERRPVPIEELSTFEEAGACGTAAVISPISYIDDLDMGKRYDFGPKPGPWSVKLYHTLRDIQYGILPDVHGWTTIVK